MYHSLLVAIDVNDRAGSARILDAAMTLVHSDTSLHIMNVVPTAGMAIVGSMLGPDHSRLMMEEAGNELRALVASSLPKEIKAELHTAQGTIYDQIIKTADRLDVDLIVVGSHRPEFQDYLVGPNSARVVRHSSRSVLIVR